MVEVSRKQIEMARRPSLLVLLDQLFESESDDDDDDEPTTEELTFCDGFCKDDSSADDDSNIDELYEGKRKPSEEYHSHWIWVDISTFQDNDDILGKWLVFKHKSEIDETWETVRSAILSGNLGSCKTALVSTMKPSLIAFDDHTKVICVYTTAQDMDDIGMRLIALVRQTIRYKTDEATLAGVYRVFGSGKTTCRTLEWNNGSPKFTN